MDIISIVNTMQPNTIKRFALKAEDFPNGESGIPFMGGFVQLFDGAKLPNPSDVKTYIMPEPLPPVPNLATQLAAALLAKGVIEKSDIDSQTLSAVNDAMKVDE